MEKLMKSIDVHRTSFERLYEDVVKMLLDPNSDIDDLQGNFRVLERKMEIILEEDKMLLDRMLDGDASPEDIDAEVARADEISGKYNRLKSKIDRYMNRKTLSEISTQAGMNNNKRKVKLPQIELKKFGGDIKDWLSFWGHFRRIHEDQLIDNEDKFQYLVQSTVFNTRARQLVDSYPPTGENYPKVIESLKSRFGREDLLVEVYVRELLKLILSNLRSKVKLSNLYDQIESQLRSLETLGVKADKFAAMLYPLVESCLPEEILRVWQRSKTYDTESSLKDRLDSLMAFVRREVENEERISSAMSGFDLGTKKKEIPTNDTPVPTASGFINNQRIPKCVFCNKSHYTPDCDDEATDKLTFEQKKNILVDNGRCYVCLKFGHIARKCMVRISCSDCKERHATLMCPKRENDVSKISNTNHSVATSITVENLSNSTCDETLLQTLVVKLCNGPKNKLVRLIVDTGSQRSYIVKQTAIDMEYEPIASEEMVHALFGGAQSESVKHNCYRVSLGNLNGRYVCNFEALDQPLICSRVVSVRDGPWIAELADKGITVSDTRDGPIEVLIGADIAGKLFTGNKLILQSGLVAMETLLGWTLMGKITSSNSNTPKTSSMIVSSLFCNLDISQLWNLEVLGITDPIKKQSDKDNKACILKKFFETVTVNSEGRYEVNLPWVIGHPPLPNNFSAVKRRLDNLMKKLESDGYYDSYDQVFSEWLIEGIIEELPSGSGDEYGYYSPHRHVVKLNSATTKLRPVFDASAREKNCPSLNQCLEKGINLLELIPAVLTRFRLSRIGVISDIRKAFLQIGLNEADRNFLKFLWYDRDGQLKYYRHGRVVFGISSSPFLLAAVLNYHLDKVIDGGENKTSKYNNALMKKLKNSFYVDNCVTSVDTEEELQQFIRESSQVMMDGKFDLRGWEHTLFDDETETKGVLTAVLGLNWNKRSDTLEINFDWFKNIDTNIITKRLILSVTNRLFDPIGFSCPCQILPRLLLQKTWELKLKWDAMVPEGIKEDFLKWLRDLQYLAELKIPRWMLNNNFTECSIHMFCDASKDSYAAVVFLRFEINSTGHVQLIQAKNRISPIKKVTIPRMELLAATIGCRLLNSVLENIGNTKLPVYCWTDSTTVLSWIWREDYWKPFVWNRVQEIRSLSNTYSWFHVLGHMNPADLPSRGCSPKKLLLSQWWEGPAWLKNKEDWPVQEYETREEEVIEERRKDCTRIFLTMKNDFSIFYNYFSKYQKILNQMGWLRRFINNSRFPNKKKHGYLSLEEIVDAEIVLLKFVQTESFTGSQDEKLFPLCPFEDENGLLRIKTKITEREDTFDFLYPIVLPPHHIVTERIISHYHLKGCHVGIQGLLCQLRQKFWIIRGRKAVKSIVSKCVICQRYNVKRLSTDIVALPGDRIRDAAIFEIVGVDLAGPLFLKSKEKIWICLFTCAVYRAVHLEMVTSLSTETFLLAFRRFIARRGRPSVVYSDNGTNFVGTENLFQKIDWTKIEAEGNISRIKWKFNPPSAAWWGGWWERLIRIMKELLRKQLWRACLSFEELSSIICDCEAIINARPLTYMSEYDDNLITISPNMFMQDIKEIGTPDIDHIDAIYMRRHFKYLHRIRQNLRERFRSEYLSQLVLHTVKNNKHYVLEKGDIVLIENERLKRLDWPLGIVEEVFLGKDGNIRLARLRTANGKLMRPLQRLFPLEIDHRTDSDLVSKMKKSLGTNEHIQKVPDEKESQESSMTKPTRREDEDGSLLMKTRSGRVVKPPDRLKM